MAPKDRTSEFHSTLASIKSRSALAGSSSSASLASGKGGKGKNSEAKQPLLPKENGRSGTPKNGAGAGSKSEFGRMAGGIAKDINSTTLKLQKLAQCGFLPPLTCLISRPLLPGQGLGRGIYVWTEIGSLTRTSPSL